LKDTLHPREVEAFGRKFLDPPEVVHSRTGRPGCKRRVSAVPDWSNDRTGMLITVELAKRRSTTPFGTYKERANDHDRDEPQ
jgi:hypothetical protein